MLWVQLHPYTTAALAAGLVLIFGAAIVLERSSISPVESTAPTAWVTGDRAYFAPETSINPNVSVLPARVPEQETKTHNYISPFATSTPTLSANSNQDPPDLDTLLAALSHPAPIKTGATPPKGDYDFIPTGLISVSNLEIESPSMSDNETQTRLREYANSIGSAIRNFESMHPDQASILKEHAEAPYDTTKIRALDQLGIDYVELGTSIGEKDPVPPEAAAVHKKLVASYKNLGTKLSAVSKSPDTLIDAIETYNAAADQFARDFVSFALIFPAYGVKFMQGEAGTMFQFAGGSGL